MLASSHYRVQAAAIRGCLVAVLSIVSPAGAEEPSDRCFVAGLVFDEETRQPIANASLQFLIDGESDAEKRVRHVSTDANGRFRMQVPVGSIRLWFPELKPGYWLEPARAMTALSTSVDKPVATLDIPAKRGRLWPVRIRVEGGLPENAQPMVSVAEVEDDATRTKLINGEPVSFAVSVNRAITNLGKTEIGAFTECGKSGKLLVNVGVLGDAAWSVKGITTEILVEPSFEITKVKTVAPIADTDKVELVDENGAKATVANAEITFTDGQPLLTFHLRRSKVNRQEFTGLVVDEAGKPLSDVRVGTALGSAGGSSEQPVVANTDRDGRFRLQVPMIESVEKLDLMFVFNKEGYAGFDSPKLRLPKEPVETIDAGTFTLAPGYSLPVRIVDDHQLPLAGAVVEPARDYALRKLAIRTDAAGRGVLQNLPAGVLGVQISHGDRNGTAQLVVSAVDAENTETELRLKAPAASPLARTPSKPIATGQVAPELAIKQWSDGEARKLADYQGRVVVLDFWGMWCGPCVRSIPAMRELARKYESRGVIFLAIHTPDGDAEQLNKLQRVKDWKTAIAVDRGATISDGESSKLYGVRGFPTVVVIDREGKVAFNSSLQPEDVAKFMEDMRQLAVSLQIPWPLPEGDGEKATLQMNRLQAAIFSREIDKAMATTGE